MARVLTTVLLAFIFTGCGATAPEYTAPQSSTTEATSVMIDEPYDATWDKLIDFTSARFFAIDNYEKDSGLMTLSFSSNPERFVDCGTVGSGSDQQGWVEWYKQANTSSTVSLNGRMNLTVREESESQTRVEVNTRYVVTARSNIITEENYEWSFNTGGSDTVPSAPPAGMSGGPRKCVPTHEAERVIIEGVKEI